MTSLIFGYILPALIVMVLVSCYWYEDFRNKSPDITYGSLLAIACAIFIPVVNIVMVIGTIMMGISYLWDEIRKRQNPHAGTMNTAMSVDEEMVFDAIEQDPNAADWY